MSRRLLPVVLASAAVGGVTAVGVTALTGVVRQGAGTTIVQQAPLAAASAARGTTTDLRAVTPRELYERDARAVVHVRAEVVQRAATPFDAGTTRTRRSVATGSGFVVDRDGRILTTAHVIDGAVEVAVRLDGRRTVPARVVAKDAAADVALLQVDATGLDLEPLALGTAKEVNVGDPVVAIGDPFGRDRTLTTGVVSALQRRIDAPDGFSVSDVIQTDATIDPGASGGPLIDAAGKVVGVTSRIGGRGDGGRVGIGFAVPIDTAKELLR